MFELITCKNIKANLYLFMQTPTTLLRYLRFFFVMCLLTLLPTCSPSHTGSRTQLAGPPSGCISGRLSLRLRGNQGRTDAARPSSGGTNSAAHIHSVSKGYQQHIISII